MSLISTVFYMPATLANFLPSCNSFLTSLCFVLFNQVCLCGPKVPTIRWSLADPPVGTWLNDVCPSPGIYQYPVVQQGRIWSFESPTRPWVTDARPSFVRDRVGNHSCCAVRIAMAVSCPNNCIHSSFSYCLALTFFLLHLLWHSLSLGGQCYNSPEHSTITYGHHPLNPRISVFTTAHCKEKLWLMPGITFVYYTNANKYLESSWIPYHLH